MQDAHYKDGFFKDQFYDEKAEIGKVIDTDDVEQAREMHRVLAHGYLHDGIGGGISMDDIVLASRDLLPIGFSPQICVQVAMESVKRRLDELMLKECPSTHPLAPTLLRCKTATSISLASDCSCNSYEE